MNPPLPGPLFLGIGPPKTATTWLYHALIQHPDIHLPPMKEIGYFWEKFFLPKRNYLSLFCNRHWFFRARRQYIGYSFLQHAKRLLKLQIDHDRLRWDSHYTFVPHNDLWYSKLFEQGTISGDITPKYCELSQADITEIKRLYGPIKIVITVRDPIEREWSRAKMNLCKFRDRKPEQVPHKEWLEQFNYKPQAHSNDYDLLYKRWSDVFGKKNVHLLFFDEIQIDSWKTYNELCRFLGLRELPESYKESISQPVGIGIKSDVPKEYQEYLASMHKEKMQRFAKTFSNEPYPLNWLRKYGIDDTE